MDSVLFHWILVCLCNRQSTWLISCSKSCLPYGGQRKSLHTSPCRLACLESVRRLWVQCGRPLVLPFSAFPPPFPRCFGHSDLCPLISPLEKLEVSMSFTYSQWHCLWVCPKLKRVKNMTPFLPRVNSPPVSACLGHSPLHLDNI